MKVILFIGVLFAGILAQANTCSFYTDQANGKALVTLNGRYMTCRLVNVGGAFRTHRYRCPNGQDFLWMLRGGRIMVGESQVYCDYLGEKN